jgi:hypothetical protein
VEQNKNAKRVSLMSYNDNIGDVEEQMMEELNREQINNELLSMVNRRGKVSTLCHW